jgi:Ca-activated chloride channel family protein
MDQGIDHYTRLGLSRDATPEEIRRAYHESARRLHPDVNLSAGDTEIFLDIQESYEILSDPIKRAKYDALTQLERAAQPVGVNVLYSRSVLSRFAEPQLIYVLLKISPSTGQYVIVPPPFNLCLILDRSTSMQGVRLDTVKATAIEIARQLRKQDVFSIVSFSDRAEVLLPADQQRDLSSIETSIQMIKASGGTEMFHGLGAGLAEVRRNLRSAYVNHIILLTDGHTYGDEAQCLQLAEQAAVDGIGISGLGIGDKWNDKFIDSLASKTGGSSMFVNRSSDIGSFLKQKVHRLGQVYAERVRCELETRPGVELRYVFRLEPDPGVLPVQPLLPLGSIPLGTTLSILLEYLIAPFPAITRFASLAEGSIKLDIPSRAVPTFTLHLSLGRPISNAPSVESPPQAILEALAHLTLYRMSDKAQQEASEGDFQGATRHLRYLATHLMANGNSDLADTVLAEADNLQHQRGYSKDGEKRIKYGTRGLLLPDETEKKII